MANGNVHVYPNRFGELGTSKTIQPSIETAPLSSRISTAIANPSIRPYSQVDLCSNECRPNQFLHCHFNIPSPPSYAPSHHDILLFLDRRASSRLLSPLPGNQAREPETDETRGDDEDDAEDDNDACFLCGPVLALGELVDGAGGDGCHCGLRRGVCQQCCGCRLSSKRDAEHLVVFGVWMWGFGGVFIVGEFC